MLSLASVDRIPMAYLGLKVVHCIYVYVHFFFFF